MSATSQSSSVARFAIQNPRNGLYWSKRARRCISERGNFSTYSSVAKAEQAIRRSKLDSEYVVVQDPAQTRGDRL